MPELPPTAGRAPADAVPPTAVSQDGLVLAGGGFQHTEPAMLAWAFHQLFLSHPLPMWVYDVETLRFLEVNDAAVAAYGYSRAEFLAMRITDIRPPEDVPPLLSYVEATIRQRTTPVRRERIWRHVRKDGQVRDVQIASHDFDHDGRAAVLVIAIDVTERLQAERERDALLVQLGREADEKAAILEQMADAVLVADATGRVVLANRAAHALFGVAGPEWPDMRRQELPWRVYDAQGRLTSPDERPFLRALRGETSRAEYRHVGADGHQFWISASAGPLRGPDGTIRGVVWVGRETSEERGRREREAQSEKLRALGQMASGVAHDLNQYLGLVAGYGDLAARALAGPTPDLAAVRDAIDVMTRAAMDGSETVKRLLSFARPAQDGPADVVDVGELLREVAALTAPRWRDAPQQQGRPISMLVEIAGDTTISGWPSQLREALTNLIFNAADALPDGGTIRLSARREQDRVIVQVADTGPGIPADVLPHVFEPFFTTKGERGTGLGLAIVYRVVERHQGTVSIEAMPPGRGTIVTLDLPAVDTVPAAPPASAPADAPSGLRILVVDDEPAIAKMVAMMLTPHGHQVTTALSGEEALACLGAADVPFDLVLSDLGLGAGMNGWDLLERVRAQAPGTRFILSTGWGAQIDPEEVRARGAEGLLSKPYRLSSLLAAVAGPS